MPRIFVDEDGPTAVRLGMPFVERDAVMAIVLHWREDLVLGLRWKTVDWETLVTGGIEDGQTAETAALAEIAEETGYLSARLLATLEPVEARFHHEPKGQNRHARFTVMVLRLADGARREVEAAEAAMHEPVWLDRDALRAFRLPPAQRHALDGWVRLRAR